MKRRIKELEHQLFDEKTLLEDLSGPMKEHILEEIENLQFEIECLKNQQQRSESHPQLQESIF